MQQTLLVPCPCPPALYIFVLAVWVPPVSTPSSSLRASSDIGSFLCPLAGQAGSVGELTHNGCSPQPVTNRRWQMTTPAYLPHWWEDAELHILRCFPGVSRLPTAITCLITHHILLHFLVSHPKRLLRLESLSQGLLLREPKVRSMRLYISVIPRWQSE